MSNKEITEFKIYNINKPNKKTVIILLSHTNITLN